jgi:hexosaminidase
MKNSYPEGKNLSVKYHVITNVYDGKEQFKAELTTRNNSIHTLKKGWSIYFNSLRKIQSSSVSKGFQIQHINGDLFCLEPTKDFRPLLPGNEVVISYIADYWAIKTVDKPLGFYIVYRDSSGNELNPEALPPVIVVPFTRDEQMTRSWMDEYPQPDNAFIYHENEGLKNINKDVLCPVVPTPYWYKKENVGFYVINKDTRLAYQSALVAEAGLFIEDCRKWFGIHMIAVAGNKGNIRLELGKVEHPYQKKEQGNEAYQLIINGEGIHITGVRGASIFYGIQSLYMIMSAAAGNTKSGEIKIPYTTIMDVPVFSYRGMHLDVARNFQHHRTVKKLLKYMSMYKLNKFHFHLTDDEGWRLEIAGLPELTDIGSKRGHTIDETTCLLPSYGSGFDPNDPDSPGNGYYTRSEFIDLLHYAHRHHIEIIPAIDFPGHARAAIRSMEVRYLNYMAHGLEDKANEYLLTDWHDASVYESVQLWRRNVINIALPSTYTFIEKVIDEILSMYHEAGVNITTLHIGGDEVPHGVWEGSPICQKFLETHPELHDIYDIYEYFLKVINQILTDRGLNTGGWEEVAFRHQNGAKTPNLQLANRGIIPYCWNTVWGDKGEVTPYLLANSGYNVVLCNTPNLYFDFAYDKHPEEEGFYWGGMNDTKDVLRFLPLDLYKSAGRSGMGRLIDPDKEYKKAPRLNKKSQENVMGIQGQIWGETMTTPERVEYMALPRMLALAERAWAQAPEWSIISDKTDRNDAFNLEWSLFANKVGKVQLDLLHRFFGHIKFRIPPPGIMIKNDTLFANTSLPGLTIRYTTDGSNPDIESAIYTKPLKINFTEIKLSAFSPCGNFSRITLWHPEY